MSVVHVLDTITEWAKQNICEHVQLKMPPRNLEAADADYEYKLVNPSAFTMYVPTSEKLPPNIHSEFPSICVRFMKGADSLAETSGHLDVQFCFSAWDPGTHSDTYERNGNGWRDVWNFVDVALRAIESATHIGEYEIDRETLVEFGPLTEQEAIPDFYPLWFAWVSFRVNYALRRNIEDVQQYL